MTMGVAQPAGVSDGEQLVVAPVRHVGRWIAALFVLGVVAYVVTAFAGADIDYAVIPRYLTSSLIIEGLRGTILLTAAAMTLGLAVGVVVAVMRQSENPVLRWTAATYVWFFRGVPVLVQLLIWFNLALVIETVHVPLVYEGSTNQLMTTFVAALLGLGLAEGAVMAEIVRGGMLSVESGQVAAARALGMTPMQTMRRVILPQAMRVIVPPTGNEVISMLKYSSLAFVVSYKELLSAANQVYVANLQVIELLFVVTVWYLVLTTLLSIGQHLLERRLARSLGGHSDAPTLWARIRRGVLIAPRSTA